MSNCGSSKLSGIHTDHHKYIPGGMTISSRDISLNEPEPGLVSLNVLALPYFALKRNPTLSSGPLVMIDIASSK